MSRAFVIGNAPSALAGLPAARHGADLIVAADGGAAAVLAAGLQPHLVIGDFDSLSADAIDDLQAAGVPLEAHPVEKDESDLELALRAALAAGADELVLLGALGGRIDHTLTNLGLLCLPELADRVACVVDERSTVRLMDGSNRSPGPTELRVRGSAGDLVSLVPWGSDVTGVVTDGLRYPLRDEPLLAGRSRGLSNELLGGECAIRIATGRLLVIHTRRGADQSGGSS